MRVKMRMEIDDRDFKMSMSAMLSKIGPATKKRTIQACEEILEMSLAEVPRDTDTLANSAFYKIYGSYRDFSGEVGYGGNGDPINPKNGLRASEYMIEQHENLSYLHRNGGKAKFLEDPIREWYSNRYPRTIYNLFRDVIAEAVSRGNSFRGGRR